MLPDAICYFFDVRDSVSHIWGDFIKPFAPCAGAKCAGNNVFCFITKNSTPCASPREYLRHTLNAMHHAPRTTCPTFMKKFLSIALCACNFCAMRSAPKKASLFAPRPKLNSRRAPNFYEIDPWSYT